MKCGAVPSAASLGCIAVAVILLIAPAAYHRIVFSGQDTEEVHRFGSWLVTCATAPLALGLSGDIYVVLTEITASAMIGAFTASFTLVFLARLIHQAGRERRYSWRWGRGEFGGGVCIAAGSDRLVGAGGWREGSWTGRQRPRGLWPGGHQGRRDVAEERRLWASRGKGEADAGGGLDDAGAEL